MSARVLGVGVGLFLVILVWAIAILVCFISSRSKGGAQYTGLGSCGLAFLITLVLIFVPRVPDDVHDKTPAETITKIYDELFIWRIFLVVFLAASALAALGLMLGFYWMEPVYAKPISKTRSQ